MKKLFALLLILITTIAYAAPKYYVDNNGYIHFSDGTMQSSGSFDVKVLGAKTDGTDVSIAVQAAINAAVASGKGEIRFPSGTYYFASSVYLDGLTNVKISGKGAILTSPDKVPVFTMRPGGSSTINNVEITGLTFQGTYGPSSPDYGTGPVVGQTAIIVNSNAPIVSMNLNVHHNTFINMAGGVYITTSTGANISDNTFLGCLAEIQVGSGGLTRSVISRNIIDKINGVICDDAIAIFGPSTDLIISDNVLDRHNSQSDTTIGQARIIVGNDANQEISHILIRHNIIKNNWRSDWVGLSNDSQRGSIEFATAASGTFSSIHVSGNEIYNGMVGINIYNSTAFINTTIDNNKIENMLSSGISSPIGGRLTMLNIVSNQVYSTGGRGIDIELTDGLKVNGNIFKNINSNGLTIDQSTDVQIIGNSFSNINTNGIYISSTLGSLITNNTFTNATYGINFQGTCTDAYLANNKYVNMSSGTVLNIPSISTTTMYRDYIGALNITGDLNLGGYLIMPTGGYAIKLNGTNSGISIIGSDTAGHGAAIQILGHTHATLPDRIQFSRSNGSSSSLSGEFDNNGLLNLYSGMSLSITQTVVNGSTSGTAKFSQPFQGTTYKKVIVYLTALNGTASFTFTTAFTNTPVVISTNGLATTKVTALSTTAMTVTGATDTGYLFVEGY